MAGVTLQPAAERTASCRHPDDPQGARSPGRRARRPCSFPTRRTAPTLPRRPLRVTSVEVASATDGTVDTGSARAAHDRAGRRQSCSPTPTRWASSSTRSSRSPSWSTQRRPGLHGRRQPQRASLGKFRPGDMGVDVHAHQPAQDLLHAARRRRARRRAGGGDRVLVPFLPVRGRRRRHSARLTTRPIDRPHRGLLRQLPGSWCAP